MHTTGLTPQRDLDVALGDEHAQALGMAAEGHRRLELEASPSMPAYAVPERDLISNSRS